MCLMALRRECYSTAQMGGYVSAPATVSIPHVLTTENTALELGVMAEVCRAPGSRDSSHSASPGPKITNMKYLLQLVPKGPRSKHTKNGLLLIPLEFSSISLSYGLKQTSAPQ